MKQGAAITGAFRLGAVLGCLLTVVSFVASAVGQEKPTISVAAPASAIPGTGATSSAAKTDAAIPDEDASASGTFEVGYQDGLLSVKAEKAEVMKLLKEIGRKTRINVMVDNGVTVTGRVSVAFQDEAPEAGLRRVLDALGEKNLTLHYYEHGSPGIPGVFAKDAWIKRKAKESTKDVGSAPKAGTVRDDRGNVISYSKGWLTIDVKDIELGELIQRIQELVEEPERPFRIEASEPISAIITMKRADIPPHVLDDVVRSLGVSRYATHFDPWTRLTNQPGAPWGSLYRISRRKETQEREFIELLNGHKTKAMNYYEGGQLAKAEEEFAEALSLEPGFAEGKLYIGRIYARRKDFHAAIRYFKASLGIQPGLADALYELGVAYQAIGDHANAATSFERYVAEGKDREKQERAQSVVRQYRSEVGKAFVAKSEEAKKALADRQFEKAETIYRGLLAEHPDDFDLYQGLAQVYLATNRPRDSVELLQTLVARHPQEASYWFALGGIQMYLKDYDGAETSLAKGSELTKDSELVNRAKGLTREIKRLREKASDKGEGPR